MRSPTRAILTTSALLGVLTAGVVLVVSAPPARSRAGGEGTLGRLTHTRLIERAVRVGNWEGAAARASDMTAELPEEPEGWLRLAQARERLALATAARAAWERLDELTRAVDEAPHARPEARRARGWALSALGQRNRARACWVGAAEQLDDNPAWRPGDWRRARYYALAGWTDRAVELVATMVRDEPWRHPEVLHEPDLDPIRGDPRFAALAERVRETREQRRREREERAGGPDAERRAPPPGGP